MAALGGSNLSVTSTGLNPLLSSFEEVNTTSNGIRSNLQVSLFISPKNVMDYVCSKCGNIPLRPMTPQCCGTVFCDKCYQPPKSGSECKISNKKAQSAIVSPYITLKIGAAEVRCINYSLGCNIITCVGNNGFRLLSHMKDCPYTRVTCPGCGQQIIQKELATHRGPIADVNSHDCQYAPLLCDICEVKIPHEKMKEHEETYEHHQAASTKLSSVVIKFLQMETMMREMKQQTDDATRELEEAKREVNSLILHFS